MSELCIAVYMLYVQWQPNPFRTFDPAREPASDAQAELLYLTQVGAIWIPLAPLWLSKPVVA